MLQAQECEGREFYVDPFDQVVVELLLQPRLLLHVHAEDLPALLDEGEVEEVAVERNEDVRRQRHDLPKELLQHVRLILAINRCKPGEYSE